MGDRITFLVSNYATSLTFIFFSNPTFYIYQIFRICRIESDLSNNAERTLISPLFPEILTLKHRTQILSFIKTSQYKQNAIYFPKVYIILKPFLNEVIYI